MSEKYFNVDIDDPRASAIAEVMSNKTAKRILSLIAEKEMTGSDIASELGLPLNTVGYNIEKLLKAGLIEKSKNFFWSTKGKKMPTYKISNKKILISPKRMIPAMPMAVIGAIIGVILIVALIASVQNQPAGTIGNQTIVGSSGSETFKTFGSDAELQQYLKDNTQTQSYGLYDRFNGAVENMVDFAKQAEAPMAATADSGSAAGGAGGRASDYSQTNNQVVGVDEPDIVKNDGKYIYSVSGNSVVIVDAFPATEMKNVSSIEISDGVRNIFVNGDKLIVFGEGYRSYSYGVVESSAKVTSSIAMPCLYDRGCGGGSRTLTNVYVYDISDRENPKIEGNLSVEGNYVDARMIGNYVYLVASKYAYSDRIDPPIYIMDGVETRAQASDVMYYPGYEDTSFSFTSVVALNIDNSEVSKKVYLTGATGTVYVSENNIYMTYLKRLSSRDYNKRFIEDAVIPILPSELIDKADGIMNSDKDTNTKYGDVMQMVFEYSNSLSASEKDAFDSELQNSTNGFAYKMAKEYERTAIMKVGIDKEEIKLSSTGEVPGHLLNQFSMDEYSGNFRVATTTGETWNGNSLNHLFVLDKNMKISGSVQGLAPGESIYAVRFLGDRAYVVTFKTVDPFYVVDLSNPEKPEVLGYLKIPGYSQYLFAYDENHIVGIGKDVDETRDADKVHSPNAVYYTAIGGVKISVFDVTDFENPKETAKLAIGDRGSDSPALQDHKAVLFDKSRNLLVIPILVSELRNVSYGPGNSYEESTPVWQGAYVFDLNANEITYRGRITHSDETDVLKSAREEAIGAERTDAQGYVWTKIAINAWKTDVKGYEYETYYDSQIDYFPNGAGTQTSRIYDYQTQIQRSLFMDDVLYTISQGKIKANDLGSLDEIKSLEISQQQNYPYYDGIVEPMMAE